MMLGFFDIMLRPQGQIVRSGIVEIGAHRRVHATHGAEWEEGAGCRVPVLRMAVERVRALIER